MARAHSLEVVDGDFLRLTEQEAKVEASGQLPPAALRAAWSTSAGWYVGFQEAIWRHTATSADGDQRNMVQPRTQMPPALVVEAFVSRGMWVPAFEYARRWIPERVPDLVGRAGNVYFTNGEHDYLFRCLSSLSLELREHPEVAYWRFAAASAIGMQWLLLKEAHRILARHEAPQLRAAVSFVDPGLKLRDETRRALANAESPITLRAAAFERALAGEREIPLKWLREAIRQAEHLGAHHEVVGSGMDMVQVELLRGHFKEAASWAHWVLREMRRRDLKDAPRKLSAMAALAYIAQLTGGLQRAKRIVVELEKVDLLPGVPAIGAIAAVIANVHLLEGQYDRAEALFRWHGERSLGPPAPEALVGLVSVNLARGRHAEAGRQAERGLRYGRSGTVHQRALGKLMYGMVLASSADKQAEEVLESSLSLMREAPVAVDLAQAVIWLAIARYTFGDETGANEVLADYASVLAPLSETGWRLLAANHGLVKELRPLISGQGRTLELRLLGERTVRLAGRSIGLSRRKTEALAILVLNPKGLTAEQLQIAQYGEGGSAASSKVTASRLRRTIPISPAPYRVTVPVMADFLEVTRLLRTGEFQAAVNLYGGPLLAESEAPEIVRYREMLEEELRVALLASRDPDALITLATVLNDDLEIWLGAQALLEPGDYRQPMLTARINRIRAEW